MSDTERMDWLADNLAYIMLGADYTKGRTTMELLPNNGKGWKDGELRAAIDKARGVESKDLSTLVAEKIRSEHIITCKMTVMKTEFRCSCGAEWSLGKLAKKEDVKESMRSHHISAGLKPSEVL